MPTVHRSQAWDAFGDVISETDGRGNTTDLAYNTLGKLTTRTEASVSITYANGYQALVRPTTQYFYDLAGRQVGVTDSNGHVTTQTWNNALNKVATEFHADGGVVAHQYDALGNERVPITALGIGLLTAATARRTDYTYDALNRLVRADGPVVNGQRDGPPPTPPFGMRRSMAARSSRARSSSSGHTTTPSSSTLSARAAPRRTV